MPIMPPPPPVYYSDERATLYNADALAVLASLPTASVDALITDPPYSSGGMVRGEGAVLDPFAGSGTTGVAALIEGRSFIGAEMTEHYAEVAANRLRTVERGYRDDGQQGALDLGEGIA